MTIYRTGYEIQVAVLQKFVSLTGKNIRILHFLYLLLCPMRDGINAVNYEINGDQSVDCHVPHKLSFTSLSLHMEYA